MATFREPPLRQRYQPPIVKFHHRTHDAAGRSFKRQTKKFALRIFVNRNDEPDEIHADIEEERGRHQLGVAHVIIFVLVERLEPKPVGHRVLLIIIRQSARNIFASEAASDEVRGVAAGIGTKIESGTVKRVDESRRVAHGDPSVAADFRAPVWHRRKSVDIVFDNLGADKNFRADRMRKEMGAQPFTEARALG